jgi:hypothetical protein
MSPLQTFTSPTTKRHVQQAHWVQRFVDPFQPVARRGTEHAVDKSLEWCLDRVVDAGHVRAQRVA